MDRARVYAWAQRPTIFTFREDFMRRADTIIICCPGRS
jgi:hypothetical protein